VTLDFPDFSSLSLALYFFRSKPSTNSIFQHPGRTAHGGGFYRGGWGGRDSLRLGLEPRSKQAGSSCRQRGGASAGFVLTTGWPACTLFLGRVVCAVG
jgi:hypothetical protein